MRLEGIPTTGPKGGQGGRYRLVGKTGLLVAGLAANAPIFSMRFIGPATPPEPMVAVVHKVRLHAYITTGYGASQQFEYDLFRATGFSTSDSGGTALTPSKKRTEYPASPTAIQISTTGALTPGTRTLEAVPFWFRAKQGQAVGDLIADNLDIELTYENEGPVYLAVDEGLVLQNGILLGATGVQVVQVELAFSVVPAILVGPNN